MSGIHSRSAVAGFLALALVPALASSALAAKRPQRTEGGSPSTASVPAEEHTLSNGMRIVLIPRHLSPTVAGGWVAHVGSANERPGITGISHLFEHMMFKGTHVIGTRDYEKDVRLIEEQERVQQEMRAEMSKLRLAQRRGEIEDMTKPEAKTARTRELEAVFDSLVKEQRANMVKNEFNSVLQKNGATFINAFTSQDQTFYLETVPANKLELWFWMEADRLKNRVFREFYSERDVVYEERRLRTESTPTGKYDESFDAVFWDASPYSWPVVGWPSDLPNITKAQADEYYSLYYAPQNLTAFLVGDFDPAVALTLAEKYLGSIPRGARPAPEMVTAETKQLAEKRFYAEAEANPAVDVRWHTVAFQHQDAAALEVMSEVLNGPTGRLKRNLVLGSGVATAANAEHDPRKYEGFVQIHAEVKDGHSPEEVERALDGEIEKLKKEPVSADELQSVKNRYLADTYRQLTSNLQVMVFYGVADGRGDWRDFDRRSRQVLAVTADDVRRVANAYLTKENRAVAIWTRKAGSAAEDPALAGLPEEAKGMVKQMVTRIQGATDAAQIQQMLSRIDAMSGQMPAEMKPAMDYVRSKAQSRLTELGQSNPGRKE
jgi:predicted Zn-dependent peptidase